eukprot:117647_1
MFGPLLHSSDNTNSSLPINRGYTTTHLSFVSRWYKPSSHIGSLLFIPSISCICDDYCDASDNYGNYLLISLTWTCALILPIHIANTTRSIPDVSPIDWAIRAYNRGINRPEIALLDGVKYAMRPPPAMYAFYQPNHTAAHHIIHSISHLFYAIYQPEHMLCDRPNSIDYELNLNDPIPRYCNPHSILHLNVILYFCFYRLTCTLISIYILSSHSLGHILAHLKKKYRKSTRLNSSHCVTSRMPSYA